MRRWPGTGTARQRWKDADAPFARRIGCATGRRTWTVAAKPPMEVVSPAEHMADILVEWIESGDADNGPF